MSSLPDLSLAGDIVDVALLEGDFLLRSGQRADRYFDKYLFTSSPVLLERIVEQLIAKIPDGTEVIAGLELGAVPIATLLAYKTGIPAAFVRKKAKPYGTCKLAEGADISGKKVLIIEDVVTSGGQVIESAVEMRALGAKLSTVLCVIDRRQGGGQALADAGLNLEPLFVVTDKTTFKLDYSN